MAGLLRALYAVKKHPLLTRSRYEVKALAGEVLYAAHRADGKQLTGIFSVKGRPALVKVDVPDGRYENLVGRGMVEVCRGLVSCQGNPIIFESAQQ